ncbi:MAG: hypothetical protein AAF244_02340 [Pseudomonadota bacterium]
MVFFDKRIYQITVYDNKHSTKAYEILFLVLSGIGLFLILVYVSFWFKNGLNSDNYMGFFIGFYMLLFGIAGMKHRKGSSLEYMETYLEWWRGKKDKDIIWYKDITNAKIVRDTDSSYHIKEAIKLEIEYKSGKKIKTLTIPGLDPKDKPLEKLKEFEEN